MRIFNFFGNIFGYLLWWLYLIVRNYGVAIILFTVILKLLLFPFSIKQQKSMASQGKLAEKQKELQKKYGNDRTRYAEELQALYEKEGVNPGSGCLTTLIPFPIMMGLYYAVIRPLSNVLHFNSDLVNKATNMLSHIPGIGSSFSNGGFYNEIHIVQHFNKLEPFLTMFNQDQLETLNRVSKSFNFLGLDLLGTPKGSSFSSMLWLIPVLCLITYWGQQFYMNKTSPSMQGQKGCMKYAMYLLPLISVYFSFIMPGAIGFYWIVSAILGFVQSVIINRFYGPVSICAKTEAQRAALSLLEEEKIQKLSIEDQKKIESKIYSNKFTNVPSEKVSSKAENSMKKSSSKAKNDYLGSKK